MKTICSALKYYHKNKDKIKEKRKSYVEEYYEVNKDTKEFKAKRKIISKKYYENNKEKVRARNSVRKAMRSGRLVRPDKCEYCGTNCKPHAHHYDYNKRFDVAFLCITCHFRKHSVLFDIEKIKETLNRINA